MKCPYCQRPVRWFAPERSGLVKKVLPRCRACRRYVPRWPHALTLLALVALALWLLASWAFKRPLL